MYEYYASPIYPNNLLDQSLYQKSFYFYNENDNDNCQKEINNNTTLYDNFEQIYYLEDYGKKNEKKESSSIKLDLNKNKEEDNFSDTGFKAPSDKNLFKNIANKKLANLENLNTKATSLLTGKKTKNSNFENFEKSGKTNCGRKKKESLIKGNHNKYTEDNIMRKIKTNFFKFINNQLNKNLKNKNYEFLKLDSKINENLKKDYNEELMKTKIKDLYSKAEISSKYRTKKSKYSNANIDLIEKIYNEMEEIDVIYLLELSYSDLFEIFRINYLDGFLNHIRDEETKKKESENDINTYLENIKNLCLNYEDWFKNKKGRNRTKNTE